jgi:hypothetical protein
VVESELKRGGMEFSFNGGVLILFKVLNSLRTKAHPVCRERGEVARKIQQAKTAVSDLKANT